MCHSHLAARGINFPRITAKEERLRPQTPKRDERVIALRKKLLEKRAARPEKVAKRARRKAAKAAKSEREKTFRNLLNLGIIRFDTIHH